MIITLYLNNYIKRYNYLNKSFSIKDYLSLRASSS